MKWVMLFLLLCSLAAADSRVGEITLLALMENSTGQSGGVAKLKLELQDGGERVFLETFPMTKVTTQASLRFAQQIACKELDVDCSGRDFLFTIEALPGIVGGPSAGSAAAFLAVALLSNKSIPPDIAMTGTINSGGIIGPVGGLKYKIEAAGARSIKRVYIPKGTRDVKEKNVTIDLVEHGAKLNVSVREAATLGEIMELELGIPNAVLNDSLQGDGRYLLTMRDVAGELCDRTKNLTFRDNVRARNFTERSAKAISQGEYYSAASYCFRANVEYKQAEALKSNLSRPGLERMARAVLDEGKRFKAGVEARNISTLTDLQTFMAVMERVDEALKVGESALKALEKNRLDVADDLAYAEERLFSGVAWSRFFDGSDRMIVIDNVSLKSGCVAKISEAEERYNYVKSVIPEALDGTRESIDEAGGLLGREKYIMCLYTAAKAKAEADVLLSVMGVEEGRLGEVIGLKLQVARHALLRAQQKGVFPIIAFSYYEYANSLNGFDNMSALLFSEYALELSNLDIYFERHEKVAPEVVSELPPMTMGFIIGLVAGGFFVFVSFRLLRREEFKTLQAPPKRRLRGKKR